MSKDIVNSLKIITPIKDGMTKAEAKEAIKEFMTDILSANRCKNYINNSKIREQKNEELGRNKCKTLTLNDGSKWVKGDKGVERFLGAKYLEEGLKELKLENKWQATETKLRLADRSNFAAVKIIHKDFGPFKDCLLLECNSIDSYSRYAETKVDKGIDLTSDKKQITDRTGYKDFMDNTNIYLMDDTQTYQIIDTEFSSFVNSTEDTINSFYSNETISELAGCEFVFSMDALGCFYL